jgi:hypothetical protein
MSFIEQVDLRALIVKGCARSVSIWLSEPNANDFVILEPYFIKFGDPSLHYRAETQRYVYEQASQDSNAPRIPKVYDSFDHDTVTYLVMEFIPMLSRQSLATCLPQKTADAIDWLRRLPPPPGARIGPLGGGYACHQLFKEWSAPLRFSCNEALETYLNTVQLCFYNFQSIADRWTSVSHVYSAQISAGTHPDQERASCVHPVWFGE